MINIKLVYEFTATLSLQTKSFLSFPIARKQNQLSKNCACTSKLLIYTHLGNCRKDKKLFSVFYIIGHLFQQHNLDHLPSNKTHVHMD